MATLNFQQLEQLLTGAGLDSANAAIGAAIALAESGGRTDAVGDNGSSFGLWQIHLPAHPDVSQACALDPSCAAAAAVRISRGGVDWTPWSTFVSGAYQRFTQGLQGVEQAVSWAITQRFGESGPNGEIEHGTDVGVPVGTPFVTPFSGTVTLVEDRLKQDWGKRVLITIDQGPLKGLRFGAGHLTSFGVQLGQHVSAGDTLGRTGGDPSDPSSGESTGPHVEVQFLNQAGGWLNPEVVLATLGVGMGALFKPLNAGALPNPFSSSGQSSIGDLLQQLLYLLLGLALVWFGLLLLLVGSIPWGRVGQAAAGATPQGRAVQTAVGALRR